jgi:hypothetical protein
MLAVAQLLAGCLLTIPWLRRVRSWYRSQPRTSREWLDDIGESDVAELTPSGTLRFRIGVILFVLFVMGVTMIGEAVVKLL